MSNRDVTYRLRGDAADFNRVVTRAEATLSGSFRNMQRASASGGRAVTSEYDRIGRAADGAEIRVKRLVTAIGGLALGGGGLTVLAQRTVDFADNIAKTSQRLGIATDELQRYRFAAEMSGVQTATLDMGLQRFGRRLGEAAQGAGAAKPALEALNISVRNMDGTLRPVNQVFDEAINKLSQIEDVTLRNALAMKFFDSEGVALVQIGDNLERLKRQADDLGLIIPDKLLRNAENLNDQFSTMQFVLRAKLVSALLQLAPQISRIADGVIVLAENFDTILKVVGQLVKLVVAIKLASLIAGLFGVAKASLAASTGVRALTVALRGLKIATLVGASLVVLELAIERMLNALDSSGDAIQDSIEDAEKAVADAMASMADNYNEVSTELILARRRYNQEIEGLVKAEIKSLDDALRAQQRVVNDQRRLLNQATADAKRAADQFKDAFDQLAGINATVENPDLIDFAKQITEARRLLQQGDNDGAVDAALRAKDIVLALQETGNYTQAQLEGTLRKAQQVQEVASAAIIKEQEAAVSAAETTLEKIQSQINLIKSISFDFDQVGSLDNAQKLINQIKSLIERQPIVVPVELKPVNDLSPGSVDVPGFARGGYINGPGTSTSDSILARLSRGEYVIRADAVKRYGLDFLSLLNAGRLPGFATGGLVTGSQQNRAGTPINISMGGRQYPVTASPETALQLRRDTHLEQLKKGRKR